MDMYGHHTPDHFRIDDLLDFSNADILPSTTDPKPLHHHLPPPQNSFANHPSTTSTTNLSASFTDTLCVPSDDAAELEWLSRFVDDSFTDFPTNELAGFKNLRPEVSVSGGTRTKRSRASTTHAIRTSPSDSDTPAIVKPKSNNSKKKTSSPATTAAAGEGMRRCTHCASEKTPQWRTGPSGPKTLCNACGVRYKSGRLVPEYRPAASPTFVLTQHSNSHRKVMELRRQKEEGMGMGMGQDNCNHHHQFQVC